MMLRTLPALRPLAAGLALALLAACGGGGAASQAARSGEALAAPLNQAHAHNDYEHPRPLYDALSQGFMSVEADVFVAPLPAALAALLPAGAPLSELYVAHDPQDIRPERTLRSLYLEPMWALFEAQGEILPGQRQPLQLLIDFKTEAETTWALLAPQLEDYAPMLSRYADGVVEPGAVSVVISGNRPTATLAALGTRLAFIAGRLPDLENPQPATLVPLISDNWGNHFGWRGEGPVPAEDAAKLERVLREAHGLGARVRFWATPDAPGPAREALWGVLADAGLEHINTDDLEGLAAFLRARESGETREP